VELKLEAGEVHVHLEHENVEWQCSECGNKCALYDHQPERQWRHLDTCQYRTILHARPPRSNCSEHGPRQVRLEWAEPGSRFTMLMQAMAIEWLKHASQKAVGKQLRLSWDEIHGIMERAVSRGLKRRQAEPVARLGIDEKSTRRGQRYLTLVNDLDRSRVLYVSEDREQRSLDGFWATLTPEQLNSIQAVALDMWDAYLNSLRAHLPDADSKIVFDKFHIAQHLGEAVDEVRRKENKDLYRIGDKQLKETRFKWLKNPKNMTEKQKNSFGPLR